MAADEKATLASGADAGDGLRRRNVPATQAGAQEQQPQADGKEKAAKKV